MRTNLRLPKAITVFSVALAVFAIPARGAVDAIDLFLDGEDTSNPAWTHMGGLVGSTGQSWAVSGGTYRLQAPNNGLSNYGFVGSAVGSVNSDVRVTADFLNWNEPVNGVGGVFGIGARWNSTGALGNLTGYGYVYEPYAASGNGEMVLYRINGLAITDIGSQAVSLDPAKDYRFVLDVTGNKLTGQVFEIGFGKVAEKVATDSTYASGLSSVFGYSQGPSLPATDFTIGAMVVVVPEPATNAVIALGLATFVLLRRVSRKN